MPKTPMTTIVLMDLISGMFCSIRLVIFLSYLQISCLCICVLSMMLSVIKINVPALIGDLQLRTP